MAKDKISDCTECKANARDKKRAWDKVESLEAEMSRLQGLLARLDPTALVETVVPARRHYDADLCAAVIARGVVGERPKEVRADLGISRRDWFAWRADYPEFNRAVERYVQLAQSFWLRAGRNSLEAGNWQFNFDKVQRMLDQEFGPEDVDADGDASRLVHIDLAPPVCPRCEAPNPPCPSCGLGDIESMKLKPDVTNAQ